MYNPPDGPREETAWDMGVHVDAKRVIEIALFPAQYAGFRAGY